MTTDQTVRPANRGLKIALGAALVLLFVAGLFNAHLYGRMHRATREYSASLKIMSKMHQLLIRYSVENRELKTAAANRDRRSAVVAVAGSQGF